MFYHQGKFRIQRQSLLLTALASSGLLAHGDLREVTVSQKYPMLSLPGLWVTTKYYCYSCASSIPSPSREMPPFPQKTAEAPPLHLHCCPSTFTCSAIRRRLCLLWTSGHHTKLWAHSSRGWHLEARASPTECLSLLVFQSKGPVCLWKTS